ncbi:uncharacterized protein BDV17DRAFT_248821 [Aspergillus undulatus]|uniref:uncharacterized protein n=1 Tax=Aspergillus undulatus TaxID=1810928 RepID=UPI003CCCE69E
MLRFHFSTTSSTDIGVKLSIKIGNRQALTNTHPHCCASAMEKKQIHSEGRPYPCTACSR